MTRELTTAERTLMEADSTHAIIFDLDGVLFDTSGAHERAYADVWRVANVTGVPYVQLAGRRTQDVLREVLVGTSEQYRQQLVEFKQSQARAYLETTDTPAPGAEQLLLALRQRGRALGLVTGGSRRGALQLLERGQIVHFFHVIVTADDVARGKPDPAGFSRALQELRVPAKRALVVEDSHSGILSALSAGTWVASVHSGQSVSHARFCGAFPTLRALHLWMKDNFEQASLPIVRLS